VIFLRGGVIGISDDFLLRKYDENHFFSKNLVDCGFIMRGWRKMILEGLIFNESSVFCRGAQR
jgi:hypothetical protein